MLTKKVFLGCLAALLSAGSVAAQSWPVSRIPDPLREKNHAVVRSDVTEFTLKGESSTVEKRTVVVTVLDEQGSDAADFHCYTDMYSSLNGFSGELFDRDGKSVRKIRRGDLKYTDYFSGLASDNRQHYYIPAYHSYPYTVQYEYEIGYKNNTYAFPLFHPVPDYDIAVEKASYKLTVPSGYLFHSLPLNLEGEPARTSAGKEDIYEWKLENYPGLASEPYDIPFYEAVPVLYLSPDSFVFGNTRGRMSDWKEYSRWQWQLMKDRNTLPDGLKNEVAGITRNASTDREKIELLYDYLGRTTRYVSIQIGLGGFRPMTVEEVYKNKFGDCKALTFYMQAMLAACGIDSYYTEIGMYNRKLIPDFANPFQTNHVILQVPLEGEMLWLECTNPEVPFGFIHGDIAGRQALVYKDGSAEIVQVGSYPDSLNLHSLRAEVTLEPDGKASGEVRSDRRLFRYEDYRSLVKKDERERINQVKAGLGLSNLLVSGLSVREEKGEIPSIATDFRVESLIYGSVSGNRFFVPLNPFRRFTAVRWGRTNRRKSDIYVETGYMNRDTIVLNYPAGMEVETGVAFKKLDTPFGTFDMKVVPSDGKVVVTQEMLLYSGRYGKERLEEFEAFIDGCYQACNAQLVFVRKE